jgi:hypothetical protein
MADSADTTAERARCRAILGAILTNPTQQNVNAALKAIIRGTAAVDFAPPDAAPSVGPTI